ncbi:hypothetical protein HanIR_Chr12g0615221 [Helianthus annuus]|nr:hypothetical protein HanIR_Chr12g0615221 [Helianthus annuus]
MLLWFPLLFPFEGRPVLCRLDSPPLFFSVLGLSMPCISSSSTTTTTSAGVAASTSTSSALITSHIRFREWACTNGSRLMVL